MDFEDTAEEAAYRALMDASIAFEHREFARLRQGETV